MISGTCFLPKPERVVLVLIGNGFLLQRPSEERLWKSIDVS